MVFYLCITFKFFLIKIRGEKIPKVSDFEIAYCMLMAFNSHLENSGHVGTFEHLHIRQGRRGKRTRIILNIGNVCNLLHVQSF
jgi:hypothetical protein